MNKKQLLIFWVMGAALLSGCATARSIYMNAALINYSDGINMEEAKIIAQKYCLDEGINDVFISSPEVQGYFFKPQLWEVIFQTNNLSQLDFHYRFLIDKKTGEVIYFAYEEE